MRRSDRSTIGHSDRSIRRIWTSASARSLTALQSLFPSADSPTPADSEPPQVNLPHVDTELNMHQFTTFFDDNSEVTDTQTDPQPSPSHPPNPSANTSMAAAETPTEWSAVGHAATGKSGRVIHNLQEEIARLTRECSLYRSRAEETQRSNETLKIQVQNINERLRNLEQVNETNLNSIARKDRKVDELRAELQSERTKRQEAEASMSQIHGMMREEQGKHHREQARSQEIAKYHETQYEVFAGTAKRDKADMTRRFKVLWNELQVMAKAQKVQNVSTERLDVLADQKNREVEGLKDSHDKLLACHADYKKTRDDELRNTIERAHANDARIDLALASLKQTEGEMKWAIQLANNKTG